MDRFLMTKTVERVVGEVTRALQQLEARGLLVADPDIQRGEMLYRINPRAQGTVEEIVRSHDE